MPRTFEDYLREKIAEFSSWVIHRETRGISEGDDHPQYQLRSEKSQADGYASLNGSALVPTAELGTGTADSTTFLRGDGTWDTPTGSGTGDVVGPASAVSGNIAVFDGTTGKLIADGGPVPAGSTATEIEQDLGADPVSSGRFSFSDATISATSKVIMWQAPGPYTGKGTLADEAEMQPILVSAVVPAAGSATVLWRTPEIAVVVESPANGGTTRGTTDTLRQQATNVVVRRLGKTRGNVKFHYMVLS